LVHPIINFVLRRRHTIALLHQWGDFNGGVAPTRAQTFATELVSLAQDVIVAHGTPALSALHRATRTIPVVFVSVIDPVAAGAVGLLTMIRLESARSDMAGRDA
jgi:hypothetical protein